MRERGWSVGVVLCLLAGLLLTGLAPTASNAQPISPSASLSISPGAGYVVGQALVFSGNIGATGVRRIHLESNAWYSNGAWAEREGFSAQTEPNGDFSFVFPAPAMFGIRYRVASDDLATPLVTFDSKSQDLTVTPPGTRPRAGVPFDLYVDTTPELVRRPDTIGLKPLPGRRLTLQERVTPRKWENLDTTVVGPLGGAKFTVTEPVGGIHVYRVVQEDLFEGGNNIGWFPSFPTYVDIRDPYLPTSQPAGGSASGGVQSAPPTVVTAQLGSSGDRTTASGKYKWGAALFDFAWVFGESLSAGPYRGTKPKGSWREYNDGGGRINSHNGGLFFDSKRYNKPGPGDFGTTMATMRGNPRAYGRWEVRVRARSDETENRDYLVRAELVPARPRDFDCGAHTITLGELTAHGNSILVGVNAGNQQWTHRRTVAGNNNRASYNLAVEVTRTHITWFINGKPVATVNNADAVSGLPMKMRLSMVGDGQQEMNDTDILSDWQRGFSLRRGQQVTNGGPMTAGSYDAGC